MKIRIGSRESKLARWQAEWVSGELAKHNVETELVFLKTLGDVTLGPIGNVGAQGVFTNEIQRALLDNHVDLAVHSLKDLPSDTTEGLRLAAVPPREKCGDALIANNVGSLKELRSGAVIGTGSARRRAQLLAHRKDLDVRDLRGNVDTRLQKLQDGELDAIILAEAGLHRLGLEQCISQVIPKEVMLPAVGQGALGLEIREDDEQTSEAIGPLHDVATYRAVLAERSLLRTLRGGCIAPIGAWARTDVGELRLDAIVLNADGTEHVRACSSGPTDQYEELGINTADELLAQGADRLLDSVRAS